MSLPQYPSTSSREKGTVAWFDDKLGFGFIEDRSGLLIYVHYKDIRTEGHRYLRKNDKVSFIKYRSDDGVRVKDVCSAVSHKHAWRYARYRPFQSFLFWLTKRKSVRYMWCLRDDVQYVSLIRYYLLTSKWVEIYVHQFMNDDEQIWHDHPWSFISFTLAGEYYDDYPPPLQRRKIGRGQMIFRGMRYKHRNVLDETYKGRTFTLVITGKRKREWSYYASHQNKLSTTDYAKLRGMEVTVFSKGLLKGSVFPKWQFADYIPVQLPPERRP